MRQQWQAWKRNGDYIATAKPDDSVQRPDRAVSISNRPTLLSAAAACLFALTPGPATAQGLLSAVLPTSRSVQVGEPVTTFASVINTAAYTAIGCLVEAAPEAGVRLDYFLTDPRTNAVVGGPNEPVDIPTKETRTFLLSFESDQTLSTTELALVFRCDNVEAAESISGLNTFVLTLSNEPTVDVIAVSATLENDGTADIPASGGVFAIATSNVGVADELTVTVRSNVSFLPLICRTDATSRCTAPPSTSVTDRFEADGTNTYGVFLTPLVPLAFDPAHHRIHVEFRDSGGVLRGATSVATGNVDVGGGKFARFTSLSQAISSSERSCAIFLDAVSGQSEGRLDAGCGFGFGSGRGFNVATYSRSNGELIELRNFDTWGSQTAGEQLVAHLEAIPAGMIVLIAIADEGSDFLSYEARDSIARITGSSLLSSQIFNWRDGLAFAFVMGATTVNESHSDYSANGNQFLEARATLELFLAP